MYFSKNEIITLNDNKRYLILDTSLVNDNAYYKIKEVIDKSLIGDDIYISTISKDGKVYINDKLTPNEIIMVKESFNN